MLGSTPALQPKRASVAADSRSSMAPLGDAVGAAAVDLLVAQIHRNERGLPANPYTVQVQGVWRPGNSVRTP